MKSKVEEKETLATKEIDSKIETREKKVSKDRKREEKEERETSKKENTNDSEKDDRKRDWGMTVKKQQ